MACRGRRIALFLDVDGVIAEIAARPELAVVPPETRATLAELRDALEGAAALVSGRPIAALERMMPGARLAAAGLHGLEFRGPGETAARPAGGGVPRAAIAELRRACAAQDGLRLEDKGATAAVHYRGHPELARAARAAVRRAAAGRPGVAVLEGKCVVELVPAGLDKGTAIRAFMADAPFMGREPVFVGDDVTDEAGFAAVRAMGGVAVRVGPAEPTRAAWRLPDVAATGAWLRGLALSFRDVRYRGLSGSTRFPGAPAPPPAGA